MSVPVELYRGAVRVEQCDHFGHMNLQFYSAALSDSFFHLMGLIGLGYAQVQQRQLGIAAIAMEQKFRREVRAGDLFLVRGGLIDLQTNKLAFGYRMSTVADDTLILTSTTVGLPMDLNARKRTDLPDDIAEKARRYLFDPELLDR